jgi:hypothetical protein
MTIDPRADKFPWYDRQYSIGLLKKHVARQPFGLLTKSFDLSGGSRKIATFDRRKVLIVEKPDE